MIIDLVGGTGGSAFTINKNHIFTDNTARDYCIKHLTYL